MGSFKRTIQIKALSLESSLILKAQEIKDDEETD
jgi:hypothetical protein